MKKLLHEDKQYDVIILDPPAFVKKFKDRKEGLLAYQRLNELALKLLASNGILFTCSCSMHVSAEDLIEMLQRTAYRTQSELQLLERGHQGPDHPIHISIPETDYLKSLIIRKI
jgi:23S rRNA (cytosine1962-C5)-methyltransferase